MAEPTRKNLREKTDTELKILNIKYKMTFSDDPPHGKFVSGSDEKLIEY